MKEPKIHSKITKTLPEGHWLENEEVRCLNCSQLCYTKETGTVRAWIENGLVQLEVQAVDDNDPNTELEVVWEPFYLCLACFSQFEPWNIEVPEKFALRDDGKPQPGIMPTEEEAASMESRMGLTAQDLPENPFDPDKL